VNKSRASEEKEKENRRQGCTRKKENNLAEKKRSVQRGGRTCGLALLRLPKAYLLRGREGVVDFRKERGTAQSDRHHQSTGRKALERGEIVSILGYVVGEQKNYFLCGYETDRSGKGATEDHEKKSAQA